MGFIEKLYDDGVYIAENFGANRSQEFREAYSAFKEKEETFYKGLTQEQIHEYEEDLMPLRLRVESIEQKRIYVYAFRLACSIAKDMLLGGDENFDSILESR